MPQSDTKSSVQRRIPTDGVVDTQNNDTSEKQNNEQENLPDNEIILSAIDELRNAQNSIENAAAVIATTCSDFSTAQKLRGFRNEISTILSEITNKILLSAKDNDDLRNKLVQWLPKHK